MLGQRAFAAAVGAEHRDKLAAANLHGYPVQRPGRRFGVIAEVQVLRFNHWFFGWHGFPSVSGAAKQAQAFVQTAVAPQGTTPPVAVTGRPISSQPVTPPRTGQMVVFRMYSITAGLSPSV